MVLVLGIVWVHLLSENCGGGLRLWLGHHVRRVGPLKALPDFIFRAESEAADGFAASIGAMVLFTELSAFRRSAWVTSSFVLTSLYSAVVPAQGLTPRL